MKITSLFCALATAQAEHLSLLQTRASARVSTRSGVCGLGIFTETEAKDDATVADFLNEFGTKCDSFYKEILCSSLTKELFDGVTAGDAIADNPAVVGICQEISALLLADAEHKEVEQEGASLVQQERNTLTTRSSKGHSLKDDAANLDAVLSAKSEAAKQEANDNLRKCYDDGATDFFGNNGCNAHGTTTDMDNRDGCDCTCDEGWAQPNCKDEIAVKAVDDPHLTSIHGNHFDLYESGKYTLLTVPKHASSEDADLLVEAYVEKIGERKNDLWIRRLTVGGKWVGERYSFKTSSAKFGSESTHLVRVGHGDWKSPEAAEKKGSAIFKVLPTQDGDAPTTEFGQTNSKRVEVQCGPVTALVKWATVQKNGDDINHLDFRIQGLHDLSEDVGGLLADELDTDGDLSVSLLGDQDSTSRPRRRHHR